VAYERRQDFSSINPEFRAVRKSVMQGRAELSSLALGVETLENDLEDCQSPKEASVLTLRHARSGIGRPRTNSLFHQPRCRS